MDRFKCIMVPLDGSKTSYECLRLACHVARQNDSTVHVVKVLDTKHLSTRAMLQETSMDRLQSSETNASTAMIAAFCKAVEAEAGISFKFIPAVLAGPNVEDSLIDHARARGVDLIVASLASKKHVAEGVAGHVTLRLVEFSGVPVLVIPAVAPSLGGASP